MSLSLIQDLEWRGLVHQTTYEKMDEFLSVPRSVYCGFDPTADSLHVGSLLPLLTLKRFQLAGHKVIGLVGGATGMIGDPSGKSAERNLLDQDQLEHNLNGIRRDMAKFIEFEGDNAGTLQNNADWFANITFLTFLREVGKHFTINHMMAKESVKSRFNQSESGISYTEFSYMLLQAYDFYHLFREQNCTLQIGGSDQWGNITAGCELIRRMYAVEGEQAPKAAGLTFPLVTKADGGKFGKSESGTVWLSADRTPPYDLYQFFIRTADADVGRYLRQFTFLPHDEILKLEQDVQTHPESRKAQKVLAEEVCRMVHGSDELTKVIKVSDTLYSGDIANLDATGIRAVFKDAPSSQHQAASLADGMAVVDLLAQSGLCNSKGAARKDIAGGGIYLNNTRVTDPAAVLSQADLIAERFIVLRKGKKNYHLVEFN